MTTMTENEMAGLLRGRGHMGLSLPGWGNRSVWGWDSRECTLYAQLWEDSDRRDEPTIWLHPVTGRWPVLTEPMALVLCLVMSTGCTTNDALLGLAAANRAAPSRTSGPGG